MILRLCVLFVERMTVAQAGTAIYDGQDKFDGKGKQPVLQMHDIILQENQSITRGVAGKNARTVNR